MRDPGEGGVAAAHRVNAVRQLYFGLIDQLDVVTLLEIGAHEAETSVAFVAGDPERRRAHAYEASPRVFERTADLIADSGVVLHNKAVGAEAGTARFHMPRDERLAIWSSMKARADMGPADEVEVEVVTLDQAAAEAGCLGRGRRTALWIDVEGAEADVVAGGSATLSEATAVAYIELNDEPRHEGGVMSVTVIERLLEHGLLPIARDAQFPGVYNVLFLHADLLEAATPLLSTFLLSQKRIGSDPS
jgi:FkbM family methyltransferase